MSARAMFVKIQTVSEIPNGTTEGVFSDMIINTEHIIIVTQWLDGYYMISLQGHDEWIIISESTYLTLIHLLDVA